LMLYIYLSRSIHPPRVLRINPSKNSFTDLAKVQLS